MMNVPVVAIRANDISYLGLNRALNSIEGVDLYSVSFTWEGAPVWYSDLSNCLGNKIEIPNPAVNQKDSLAALVTLGRDIKAKYNHKALVFCSSDVNQIFFHENESILSNYYCLLGDSTYSDFRSDVTDKGRFFEKIQTTYPELVPISESFYSPECLYKLEKWSTFPCILKPTVKDLSQSFYKTHGGDKAVLCETRSDLENKLTNLLESGFSLLVQDFIPFGDETDEMPTYTYFDADGNLRIYANCIKDVIYPPKFGTAISVIQSFSEELIEPSKKIGNLIKWNGPLMIEFVKDRRDNSLKVLEINTRPWLFHDFYRFTDLPFVTYSALEFANSLPTFKETITPNVKHLHSRNIDLISLTNYFFKNNIHESITTKEKTLSLIKFCKSNHNALYFAHHDPEDVEPFNHVLNDVADLHKLDLNLLRSNFT